MKRVISQEILGMARVGDVQNRGTTYEIFVNTNDAGRVPHFHSRDKNDWEKFHTCIRIDCAEYFLHGAKQDILSSSLKKTLQKFMTSKVTLARYADKFDNNWELVCFLWDINNSDVQLSGDVEQPDYTEL